MNGFRFGIMIAVMTAAVFLIGCIGGGKGIANSIPGQFIVGKDISTGDITDFYYTYDRSTNPPVFQRYRFYIKDGTRRFYHEKREGDHWPLRDKDVTVSGTKELTQEEWNAFLNCVSGGKVEKRKEHLETGNAGPWLFLYWKGDKSKYQEFTFASLGARTSFEKLCARLKEKQ